MQLHFDNTNYISQAPRDKGHCSTARCPNHSWFDSMDYMEDMDYMDYSHSVPAQVAMDWCYTRDTVPIWGQPVEAVARRDQLTYFDLKNKLLFHQILSRRPSSTTSRTE